MLGMVSSAEDLSAKLLASLSHSSNPGESCHTQVSPSFTDPNSLTRGADFRVLLCHFPRVLDRLEPGTFELVLAGHMHDGQITVPYPGGKVRLAHPTAPYASGVYRSRAGVMHVSPGLGTTFVPLRFGARPEATELVLRSP